MTKRRIFIDMDGVLADYDRACQESGTDPDVFHHTPGAFRHLPLFPGAVEAVSFLEFLRFDLFVASKPSRHSPSSTTEKVLWLHDHFPQLGDKLILTHDKGLLGDANDFLIDDRIHVANCDRFAGTLLHFRPGFEWPEITDYFRIVHSETPRAKEDQARVKIDSSGASTASTLETLLSPTGKKVLSDLSELAKQLGLTNGNRRPN